MKCSNCNKRCKEYYHSDCFSNYLNTTIANNKKFICQNCLIFRHGIIKNTGQQMDPHLNKQECDRLKKENLIFGCGKPFMIIENDGEYLIIDCDYI